MKLRISGVLAAFGLVAFAVSAADAAPKPAKGCAKLVGTVAGMLDARVGGLIGHLGFHVRKSVLGVSLSAKATAPKLSFSGKAEGSQIKLTATLEPGTLEAKIDAGLFGKSGGKVSFPAKALSASLTLPCATDCAGWANVKVKGKTVIAHVTGFVNEKLIAKLPTRISVKDLAVSIAWPKVSADAAKKKINVKLSAWGVKSASYNDMNIPFADKVKMKAVSFALACPSSGGKPAKPNIPPVVPADDDEFSCDTRGVPHKINFEFGKDVVNASYKDNGKLLPVLERTLRKIPAGCNLQVVGHTDCVGTQADNQGLGQRRADATASWIAKVSGLPKHLKAKGAVSASSRSFTKPWCKKYEPKPSIRMDQTCHSLKVNTSTSIDTENNCPVSNRRVDFHVIPVQSAKK